MKRLTVLVLAMLLTIYPVCAADYTVSDWAREEIARAEALGMIPAEISANYTDNLTRREFVQLAVWCAAAMCDTDTTHLLHMYRRDVFTDTQDPYAAAAYEMGIIQGVADGIFAPNETLTREQAAKILVQTYRFYTGDTGSEQRIFYTDDTNIAPWAQTWAYRAGNLGVLKGTPDGAFLPKNGYTKEQGIVSFLRLYDTAKTTEKETPAYNGENAEITEILRVHTGELYAGDTPVVLNGINLGNWLLWETWMGPFAESAQTKDNTDFYALFQQRFGTAKTDILFQTYQDNFITESDFAQLETLGFNCVRLPFWYRNFMDENGNFFTENHDDNPGFRRLDQIVEYCRRYGIYVVLDMHGCPGGQSMNHSTGQSGQNLLYDNEIYRDCMKRLWSALAERYKNEAVIAAYDIMNEPQNNGGYESDRAYAPESAEAVTRTNGVYDEMIKAIRQIDPNHVISVEGIWALSVLPTPQDAGWDNMLYQLHLYDDNNGFLDYRIQELLQYRENHNVAVMVGEYNNKVAQRYASYFYCTNRISRIKWSYKTIDVSYDNWGLYNKQTARLSAETDSYETILNYFENELQTQSGFVLNLKEYNKIRE